MPDIILASNSAARKAMLDNAGLTYRVVPADIDEHAVNYDNPETAVIDIAKRKALAVSEQHPDALVIGSDQVAWFDDRILSKASDKDAAITRLQFMAGHAHDLYAGVCVVQNGEVLWHHADETTLAMHGHFSDDFWLWYADQAGDVLTTCVGGYAYEQHGAWLFDTVQGDYFTILGMPLRPLLHYLRIEHGVNA